MRVLIELLLYIILIAICILLEYYIACKIASKVLDLYWSKKENFELRKIKYEHDLQVLRMKLEKEEKDG